MSIRFTTLLFLLISSLLFSQEIYRAENTRINNLQHTKLKVSFDFQTQTMFGEAWIQLLPHFYPTDSLSLNAKSMLIHEVAMFNQNQKYNLNYTYEDDLLKIDLGRTFTRDQSYEIYIQYTAQPEEVKATGSSAISQAKGLYFINPLGEIPNKPTQIWTQGEPESNSVWFPTIDSPNQKTSQEIYMTVPSEFVTLSNGKLISQTENNDNTRTDYWRQDLKHTPYLFFMSVGDFAVVKDQWKNIPVDYYVEHEYAEYAQEIFGNTPEMLTFFSDILDYEYPWDKYSQIVVRDYVSGAMENTGAVVHLERAQQKPGQLIDENIWEDVIVHEAIHHWFGNLVTTESWANLSMNEAFANYSEYLWREYKYGKASADEHRYQDLQSYFNDDHFAKDLVRFYYDDKEDMFDVVTYNKGGYILHMLRSYLGDDAFFRGLNKYLVDNEYGKGEAHEFRLALEEISGRDLNWFFNQWFFGNGHPKLHVIVEKTAGTSTVNIKQNQMPLFEFPLTIDIYENGVATRHQVWVKKQSLNTFKFSTQNEADLVLVNADHDLIAEITQEFSTQENANRYSWAKDEYTERMLALTELSSEQLMSDVALNTLFSGLNDSYHGIRTQVLYSTDIDVIKNNKNWINKIEQLASQDPKTLVQAAALERLALLENPQYMTIFENAMQSVSYSVQAAALLGISKLNQAKALEFSDTLDEEVFTKSQDLLAVFLPHWKVQNNKKYFNSMAESAAFYGFTALQDPQMGRLAEQAFVWIMESDSPDATSRILNHQMQAYNYLKDLQPMALPFIKQMVQRALNIKVQAAQQNPSRSMEIQIEEIQATLDKM